MSRLRDAPRGLLAHHLRCERRIVQPKGVSLRGDWHLSAAIIACVGCTVDVFFADDHTDSCEVMHRGIYVGRLVRADRLTAEMKMRIYEARSAHRAVIMSGMRAKLKRDELLLEQPQKRASRERHHETVPHQAASAEIGHVSLLDALQPVHPWQVPLPSPAISPLTQRRTKA